MKIIRKATPAAALICGEQKKSDGLVYRPSLFCVEATCDDGVLLYHTLTGALLLLEDEKDRESRRDFLIRHRFLVPEGTDEPAFADKVLGVVAALDKNGAEHKATSFTILTTTDCNARCYYCYEAGVAKKSMDPETAVCVADYIRVACGGEKVELNWFGGEPLFHTPPIDLICAALRESGVSYRSSMITNGYYLTADLLQKAVDLWRLKRVQITLDGTAGTYNRVKAYTEGGDAFARVITNIENTRSAGVEVYIRLNVGKKNVSDLTRLADELAERFPDKKNLFVYPSLLGEFHGGKGRFAGEDGDGAAFLDLKKKLTDLGFAGSVPPLKRDLRPAVCKADGTRSRIILPDGSLCCCDHDLEGSIYGRVDDPERDEEMRAAWREEYRRQECFSCPLYPRCRNLKKCDLAGDRCPSAIRAIRLNTLQEQIRSLYKTEKEKKQ